MKREAKVLIFVFLNVLILLALPFAVKANSIGIHVGSWAKYDIDFDYSYQSENETIPEFLEEAKRREWNNVTVTDIQDTNVTIKVVTHFSNGTEVVDTYYGNISSGEGTFPPFMMPIIRANLSVWDDIVVDPTSTNIPKINKTTIMNFAGASREVNFVPVFQEEEGFKLASYFYYDRHTGILCESGYLTSQSTESYNITYDLRFKMLQTNIWEPEPSSGLEWWLVGVTGTVIVVVPTMIYYFSKRRNKHRKIVRLSRKGR